MIGKSINYYGYDKETYYECGSMIRTMNRNHIIVINIWFLIVDFIYLVLAALNLFGVNQERVPFYAVYLLISLVFALLIGLFPKFAERHCFFFLYINMFVLLSYGILVSIAHPYLAATLYLILLTVVSLTYIGTMVRMLFVTLLASIIFLYTSFKFKTFSIAYTDAYNITIVWILCIGMHYIFQRMRIQQFVLHQRNMQIQNELEVKSSFDTLTGLLNRGRFFSIAEEIINQSDQDEDSKIAVCLIDLDGFKEINDSLGHQMGDKAIQVTGHTLIKNLNLSEIFQKPISEWDIKNMNCIAGRLGGDEFITLVRYKEATTSVQDIMQRILNKLNKTELGGLKNGIRASIGITMLESGERDVDAAYKRADDTLYISKNAGKNQVRIFGEHVPKSGNIFKRS